MVGPRYRSGDARMIVAELIEELKTYDPNTTVIASIDLAEEFYDLVSVEQEQIQWEFPVVHLSLILLEN